MNSWRRRDPKVTLTELQLLWEDGESFSCSSAPKLGSMAEWTKERFSSVRHTGATELLTAWRPFRCVLGSTVHTISTLLHSSALEQLEPSSSRILLASDMTERVKKLLLQITGLKDGLVQSDLMKWAEVCSPENDRNLIRCYLPTRRVSQKGRCLKSGLHILKVRWEKMPRKRGLPQPSDHQARKGLRLESVHPGASQRHILDMLWDCLFRPKVTLQFVWTSRPQGAEEEWRRFSERRLLEFKCEFSKVRDHLLKQVICCWCSAVVY